MLMNKKIVIPGIVATVMLILAFAFYTMATGSQQQKLDTTREKYAQLSNKKSMLEAALATRDAKAVQAGTGMDAQRKAKDDKAAAEFARLVSTWDSKKSYDAARKKAIAKYHLKKDGMFLKTFMYDVPSMKNADGKGTFNEIDASGLNMAYQSMSSYVTKIVGDKYTYLATVKVSSSSKSGNTANGDWMLIYTTDGNHELSNIEAYRIND